METSLHRQLKQHYADADSEQEVTLGRYRIDVVRRDWLIEIQHGSLAAIRDKVRRLLASHRVLVVKPIVVRKLLVKRAAPGGRIVSRRTSPKRGRLLDLFDDLVYFTQVYPHPNLVLEVPLVEVEEYRYPGHGRRRWRRPQDFQVEDQRLLSVGQVHRFQAAEDLLELLPPKLPRPFHTGHLADGLQVPRWLAQRIAYCLRQMNAVQEAGKLGNARLYRFDARPRTRRSRSREAS